MSNNILDRTVCTLWGLTIDTHLGKSRLDRKKESDAWDLDLRILVILQIFFLSEHLAATRQESEDIN